MPTEMPWAWYLSRSSALIGFLLLYVSIFLGLAIRTPIIKKFLQPVYSLEIHCWISVQALIFAAIHGGSLLFDKYLGFNLGDILIPFVSDFKPGLIALGLLAFYLMIMLVVFSYAKRHISYKIWRWTHSLNIFLYVFVLVHAFYLGTDLKSGMLRDIFIWANLFLVIIFLTNIIYRISVFIKHKKSKITSNEDIYKNPSQVIPK